MEDFKQIFETAKQAQKSIPDALAQLQMMQKKAKQAGKQHVSDEQLNEIDRAINKAIELKKQLDNI